MDTSTRRFATNDIEQLLRSAPEQIGEPFHESRKWSDLLSFEIGGYHAHLEADYRDSQATGLYGSIFCQDFPHLTLWVERLRSERMSILGGLAVLLEDLRGATTRSHVTTSLAGVVERIRCHDHDENDLLQQAYSVDLGAGG